MMRTKRTCGIWPRPKTKGPAEGTSVRAQRFEAGVARPRRLVPRPTSCGGGGGYKDVLYDDNGRYEAGNRARRAVPVGLAHAGPSLRSDVPG